LLEPVVTETYLGRAEVRNTFRVKGAGTVAGCYVVDGILKTRRAGASAARCVVIYTSKLSSLKRFKDDASEVRTGLNAAQVLPILMTSRSATSSNASRSRDERRGSSRTGRRAHRKEVDRLAVPREPHMPVGLLTLELHILTRNR